MSCMRVMTTGELTQMTDHAGPEAIPRYHPTVDTSYTSAADTRQGYNRAELRVII